LPKSSNAAKPPKPPRQSKPGAAGRSAKPGAKSLETAVSSVDVTPAGSLVPDEAPGPPGPAASSAPGELIVPLGADLRIGRARDVYTALIQGAVPGTVVIVEGAEVAKVDAAGLQCVLAAAVRLRTAGATWRWHNPSPALRSAAQLLGLDGALELT